MYPGPLSTRYGRSPDTQMTVIEKLLAHRSLGSGRYSGPHGEAQESFRRQREPEENVSQEPLLWFLQEGMGKAGYTCVRLAILNHSGGLCGIESVPGSLVPRDEYGFPECESQIQQVLLRALDRLVCLGKTCCLVSHWPSLGTS